MVDFNAAANQPPPTGNGVDVINVAKADVIARGQLENQQAAFALIDPYHYVIWLAAKLRLDISNLPDNQNVYDAVAGDLERRAEAGTKKYGTRLKTHNGRNAKFDAYQELLDFIDYSCQSRLEGQK